MNRRLPLIAINALGGGAVLASYAYGLSSPHAASGSIWGGVPESAQGLYTASMLLAATGYFPFTYLFAFAIDPTRTRIAGFGMGLVNACYALVLLGSALWMPLTDAYLDAPSGTGWVAVKTVLVAVALGSLGLMFSLTRIEPRPAPWLRRLAIAGCLAFCFQTVVLDACIWVMLFPS